MSAAQYVAYVVKDYLDFASVKEDGLGSTSAAGSIRLDAWIVNGYLVFAQTAPASSTPSKALLGFIKSSQHLLERFLEVVSLGPPSSSETAPLSCFARCSVQKSLLLYSVD